MPLVRRNRGHYSGVVADHANFQRFTTTGSVLTWTKPNNATIVYIECIGAGGSGGGGASSRGDGNAGGGGGGGGSFVWGYFNASTLPATLDIYIGAGSGAVGANTSGGRGGDSWPQMPSGHAEAGKVLLKAYGGGGGVRGGDGSHGAGGGGGGTGERGSSGSGTTGGNGGNPTVQGEDQGYSLGGRGGKGGNRSIYGNVAEYGGGGGAGGSNNNNENGWY